MKTKSKLLYEGILLLGIVLIGYAGFKLYERYADLAESNRLYEELNEQYVSESGRTSADAEEPDSLSGENDSPGETTETGDTSWHNLVSVDFESLKELNPDVVGWLLFEDESISYPILYSGDNSKYLRTTIEGKSATGGSIFVEGENSPDFEDSRTVVYGHNMSNLSMFGKLKFYRQKDYYEDHQYFQILMEDIVYRYRIFSYFDVAETEAEMCRVNFVSEDDFSEYISELQRRSLKDTGIEVDSDDKVVTLLTCFSKGRRTLVNAVRVDSYETGVKE